MGQLIDGRWSGEDARISRAGAFQRPPSALPSMSVSALADRLRDEADLVLVASLSCPWSHRATLVRSVKALRQPRLTIAGGPRVEGYALPPAAGITLNGRPARHLHQLYTATEPRHTGRATVPLIWSPRTETILCNESSVIARALDAMGPRDAIRLAPAGQAAAIDALNAWMYSGLANAVYRAGFATTQAAHDAAVAAVFETLDALEDRLAPQRCLLGGQATEADLFLFATLVRFDAVYAPLFRCTRRRLVDYQALWAFARDVHRWPGVAETVDADANRAGYFLNDTDNNPHRIVPAAPDIDWAAPHGRAALGPLLVSRSGALTLWDAL